MIESKRNYCTYFDSNYLLQGLALYHSLDEHSQERFVLWVLCFDKQTFQILQEMALPNMRLIDQKDFENGDEGLRQAKQNRTAVEYYWTCTPSLPLYIFEHNPQVELITYLDADLYFFSEPGPIFEELGKGSILIIGHRFPPELLYRECFGIYNVGVLCFRRDKNGLAALQWWRERCNEWCSMDGEEGKYGDQKYLDDWPVRFVNVVVLQHKGAGLAPWNLAKYVISIQGKQLHVHVDEVPLIFYHFAQFKMVSRQTFIHNIEPYLEDFDTRILEPDHIWYLYVPYAQALQKMGGKIREQRPDHQIPYEKVPFLIFLHMISKGKLFLARDNGIAHLIMTIGFWRAEGDMLVRKGFRLNEKGDRKGAAKALLAAACRSPRILLHPMFWQVVTR